MGAEVEWEQKENGSENEDGREDGNEESECGTIESVDGSAATSTGMPNEPKERRRASTRIKLRRRMIIGARIRIRIIIRRIHLVFVLMSTRCDWKKTVSSTDSTFD